MRIPGRSNVIKFYIAKDDKEAYDYKGTYGDALVYCKQIKAENPEVVIYGIVKVNTKGHSVYIVN